MTNVPLNTVHVVSASLPQEKGYTLRTQRIVASQLRLGMTPVVLVVPNRKMPDCQRVDRHGLGMSEFGGVQYFFLSERSSWRRVAIRLTQHLRKLNVRGAWRFGYDYRPPDDSWRKFEEVSTPRFTPLDIVHAHTPARTARFGLALARRLGRPFVYEVRGFWDLTGEVESADLERSRTLHEEWRATDIEIAREADVVITLGHNMKMELVSRGIPAERVTVVPNAVDCSDFPTGMTRDKKLAGSLGLSGEFVIGYATAVRRLEGIHVVLDALRILKDRNVRSTFLLLGDGPALGKLREQARTLGVDDCVRFVGRVPHRQVLQYYSLMDAFVVPRIDAAVCRLVTPLKPLEAMACAIPIIASNLPALRECVEPESTGLLFQPENADSLADAITRLSMDSEFRKLLGANAATWVRNNRDIRILGERSSEAYEIALSNHRDRHFSCHLDRSVT